MMKLTISLLLVFQVVVPMPHNTVNHPNEITNPANPKLSQFMPVNSIPHKIFRRSLPFSLDKKKDKEGTKAETHRDDASGGNDYSQQLLPNQVGHAPDADPDCNNYTSPCICHCEKGDAGAKVACLDGC